MDNHFEVMWDTFRDVPSLRETPDVSVLDSTTGSISDPNYSLPCFC